MVTLPRNGEEDVSLKSWMQPFNKKLVQVALTALTFNVNR